MSRDFSKPGALLRLPKRQRPIDTGELETPVQESTPTKETLPWALRMRSEGALRTLLQFCDEGGGTYNGYTRAQIELALMYCRK